MSPDESALHPALVASSTDHSTVAAQEAVRSSPHRARCDHAGADVTIERGRAHREHDGPHRLPPERAVERHGSQVQIRSPNLLEQRAPYGDDDEQPDHRAESDGHPPLPRVARPVGGEQRPRLTQQIDAIHLGFVPLADRIVTP